MNRETAKKMLPLIKAFSEGKAIQVKDGFEWLDVAYPGFMEGSEYRIKPDEPNGTRFRPWEMKEVPIGAWVRWKDVSDERNSISIILAVSFSEGIVGTAGSRYTTLRLFEKTEVSMDSGKTWGVCGVEIND